MNILLINFTLGSFKDHSVKLVNFEQGGIVSLLKLLRKEDPIFNPKHIDLLIQRKVLGKRVFFKDLAKFSCPKIFWAIDSHLNMYWQRWYGRIFDLVLTPHPSLFKNLPAEWQVSKVKSMAFPGYDYPWNPHAKRANFSAFVGRIDQNRSQRARFADFLLTRHGIKAQQLHFDQMLALYFDTKVLPNESICREFNFRIMEGASCGCCVLTEDIGEDLSCNFKPGLEVLTYRNSLELDSLLNYLKKHQVLAEKIGQAAWIRVQKEHLVIHRQKRLLSLAGQISQKPLSQEENDLFCLLAATQAARGDGSSPEKLGEFLNLLAKATPNPDIWAMQLRLTVESNLRSQVESRLQDLVSNLSSQVKESFDLGIACLGAALFLEKQDLLAQCLHLLNLEQPLPTQKPFYIIMALTDHLLAHKRIWQPGFSLRPKVFCPETALEMLLLGYNLAKTKEEENLFRQKMGEITDHLTHYDLNLDAKAELSLYNKSSWQDSLAYAVACLQAFRYEAVLEELKMAKEMAEQQGDLQKFKTKLKFYGFI